jgi:4-carboxymuconolactone decarboxylase
MTTYPDGARIPPLDREAMTDAQKHAYDAALSGQRKTIIGPLRAAIFSPDLAEPWSALGEYLRFGTSIPPRLKELAIIATARRWTSGVEWWVHARVGREAGLPEPVIDAIARAQPPVFAEAEAFAVYEFTRALQNDGVVPDDVYDAVAARWDVAGVVELTAIIGYYTMVAMTLNAHRIPVPEGGKALPPENKLITLPPARREDRA